MVGVITSRVARRPRGSGSGVESGCLTTAGDRPGENRKSMTARDTSGAAAFDDAVRTSGEPTRSPPERRLKHSSSDS